MAKKKDKDKRRAERKSALGEPVAATVKEVEPAPDGSTDISAATRKIAETVTSVVAAFTALGGLIAISGSAIILERLDDKGLPGDLGVVASLPNSFVLATGLTYIGLPLALALIFSALAAYVVGPSGENPKTKQRRWPWRRGGRFLVYVLAIAAFLISPLVDLLTDAEDPHPVWWLASVVAGVTVVYSMRRLWREGVSDRERPGVPDLRPVLELLPLTSMVVLSVFVWALAGALQRGDFPPAVVCTNDSPRGLQGYLISETSERVFVGEPNPALNVLAYYPSDEDPADQIRGEVILQTGPGTDGEGVLDKSQVRFRDFGIQPGVGIDVVIFDVGSLYTVSKGDAIQARVKILVDSAVPLVGITSDRAQAKAAEDIKSLGLLGIVELEKLSKLDGVLDEFGRELRGPQRITSIPSGLVTRTYINGLGTCPSEATQAAGSSAGGSPGDGGNPTGSPAVEQPEAPNAQPDLGSDSRAGNSGQQDP